MAGLRTAILISGRGSNMQALINATRLPNHPATIVCVISNVPDAKGLQYAKQMNIPTEVINHREYKDRESFEMVLDEKLRGYNAELVCLAGWMRLLTSWFTDRWRDKLINIHPSLLPAFPGISTHRQAIEYGVKLSGCTVHFVRAEMDHGPIILQASVPVLPDDTEQSLEARILVEEHKIFPEALRLIAEGRVNIHRERVFITDAPALAKIKAAQ